MIINYSMSPFKRMWKSLNGKTSPYVSKNFHRGREIASGPLVSYVITMYRWCDAMSISHEFFVLWQQSNGRGHSYERKLFVRASGRFSSFLETFLEIREIYVFNVWIQWHFIFYNGYIANILLRNWKITYWKVKFPCQLYNCHIKNINQHLRM